MHNVNCVTTLYLPQVISVLLPAILLSAGLAEGDAERDWGLAPAEALTLAGSGRGRRQQVRSVRARAAEAFRLFPYRNLRMVAAE